jgi:hypothetical protein
MKRMLKILSTFWLSFMLATMPLQALTAAVETVDADPCQMHSMHGDSAAADEGCPNCADNNCASEGCNHKGCTSFHIQLAKLTQPCTVPVMPATVPIQTAVSDHTSRTTPPLLRPPA